MLNKSDLIQYLVRMIWSNRASTFFLNGSPNSGKSFLLNILAERLPGEIKRCIPFGPYQITAGNQRELGMSILHDCLEAGFLDCIPQGANQWNLVDFWHWIQQNAHVATKHTFLVLIDLGKWTPKSLKEMARLFSVLRTLEGNWDSRDVRWLQICAGCWDHPAMESYYKEIETSFPYTVGYNYAVWEGISLVEMRELMDGFIARDSRIPYERMLHEFTGGHPGAAIDILNFLPERKLTVPAIIFATKRAACEGPASQALLEHWVKLSTEAKQAIKAMLLGKRIPVISLPPHLEILRTAGIANLENVGAQSYLELRSWFVEMVLWQHLKELEIADDQTEKVDIATLIPKTSTVCTEAYLLINEIENLVRNFITIRLSLQGDPYFHYLMGKSRKYNNVTRAEEDAYQRAEDWQTRSLDRGLRGDINPLIAYLSTRDLADLIEELGGQTGSPEWLRIAQAIRSLSNVRDAVMHNQLIDDVALQRLYDLQAEIYAAMSQPEIK